jgi:hypothetical protein
MAKLTVEQKARFAPILKATWEAIAFDVGSVGSVAEIVEITCDANRPEQYGMSREDYRALSAAYSDRDTQRWLRSILNYETR